MASESHFSARPSTFQNQHLFWKIERNSRNTKLDDFSFSPPSTLATLHCSQTREKQSFVSAGRSLVSLYPHAKENMGATGSTGKRYPDQFHSNIYSTPPKPNPASVHNRLVHLQCDPRSPTGKASRFLVRIRQSFFADGISRTPIQIDSQLPVPPVKLYNQVLPHIVGPDIIITQIDDEYDQENELRHRQQHKCEPIAHDAKRVSGIEPTLDPSKVLTALIANDNGQLPPYQL